jgi:predicted kinase
MTDLRATPRLLIFAGLPGSGKSTLAKALAREIGATYLRIDTIEQGLRDLCSLVVTGEGYGLAYRIAADNLRLGQSVVADACNPIDVTRRAWEQIAREAGVPFVNVEVVCSDQDEHRARVESRAPEVVGLRLPTWLDVQRREYDDWTVQRVVVDTAGRGVDASLRELLARLRAWAR